MSLLLHQVAELTHLCDQRSLIREALSCIAGAVDATSACYLRVAPEGEGSWECSERFPSDLLSKFTDWANTQPLASSDLLAERHEAVCSGCTRVSLRGDNYVTVIPFPTDDDRNSLVEIETRHSVDTHVINDVVAVLRICRNIIRLLNRGDRDSLTRLYNRKTFESTYQSLAMRLPNSEGIQGADRRKSSCLWLAMFDADHFKRINDTHGHLIGDEVLVGMAGIMSSVFSGNEYVYRFGGEEFVALIPANSKVKVISRLETIRARTQAHVFAKELRVTVSIGVTAVRGGETSLKSLERADKAVYTAKRHGRNRIVFDDDIERFVASEPHQLAESGR